MDEFAALAQRVVLTMDDVRGCLVLSRDGLVLGAFPEEQEADLKPAWLRFTHVGEARKGFVEFSDQLWAFVHRGPYAAFVVTGTSVRPGVMLDQLEQAVIAAEEARAKQKEITLKVPDAASAPSGRPRTSLHPPTDRPTAAPVAASTDELAQQPQQAEQHEQAEQPGPPQRQRQPMSGYRRPDPAPTPPPAAADPDERPAVPPAAEPLSGTARPSIEGSPYEAVLSDDRPAAPFGSDSSLFARLGDERLEETPRPGLDATPFGSDTGRSGGLGDAPEDDDDAGEVDRVMLAKEFSGLLQLNEGGDDN